MVHETSKMKTTVKEVTREKAVIRNAIRSHITEYKTGENSA